MIGESIVVTGGGTGGHLKVAKAFIDEFHENGYNVIYIGSMYGADKEWFEHDIHIHKTIFLDTVGVVNKGFFGKISALLKIVSSINRCLDIFDNHDIKRVVSVGGYSAAAASLATIFCDANLFIHEQNSRMGSLNKLCAKFAKEVFSSYDEASKVKDYPVEMEFFDLARVRTDIKTVIFLGGSQGARAINDFALSCAKMIDEGKIDIIHQTGRDDFERVKAQYERLGIKADVFDFTKELPKKMSKADFAISRAGASTLWELVANALPTLFIPYPYAAGDHQYYNARYLEEKGICYLKREGELNCQYLFEILQKDIHPISKVLVDEIMIDGIAQMREIILAE